MAMTVAQLQAALDKIEDKQREVVVCIGNPLASEDFSVEDVFCQNFPANDVAIMVFAEGKYDFQQFDRERLSSIEAAWPKCQNCGKPTWDMRAWRNMQVCPQCKADLTRDKGPDMEEAIAAAEARGDAKEDR